MRVSMELGRSEWAVMEGLWSRGRSTATDLQRDLEDAHGWAYSTVKTMLDRLVTKGFVKARRVGNVYEYTPNEVKQTVCGYGGAGKQQVQRMVQTLLNLEELPKPDDAADALAVAICHIHHQTFNNLIESP